ncbi:terminase small subunit [Sinorhizobium meliloti]|nr:terminase small subunit [Sinorhizobium meliloti]
MSELNAQQLRFVSEYLIDLNATQAAIRAGYSAKTAKQQGNRLLTNVDVQRAVADAQYRRAHKTEIDAAFVLKRLAEEVSADIADLYDDAGKMKPVKEWPLIWRQGLVAGVDIAEETSDDGTSKVTIRKLKLSDRAKRLELLGKHISVNAFREQVGHGDPDGNPLPAPVVDELSKNDIARRVAFLLAQGLNSAAK